MSVKPVLMKLYEEHFLPLGTALIPSLPGLVLGLLPGIEEGSDYTERYKCITLVMKWDCRGKNLFVNFHFENLMEISVLKSGNTN